MHQRDQIQRRTLELTFAQERLEVPHELVVTRLGAEGAPVSPPHAVVSRVFGFTPRTGAPQQVTIDLRDMHRGP